MFVRWRRRRLRGQFTLLINGELSARQTARLQRCLAADPVLAVELSRFESLLADLGRLPQVATPRSLARDLQIEVDLMIQPLRERYGELLDGSLATTEAATLRAAIAAEPQLQAEFALLEAAVSCLRASRAEPVPAALGRTLRHRLEDAVPPPPSPAMARLPRLAWATALLLFALGVGLITGRREQPSSMGGTLAASSPAPEAPAPRGPAPATAPFDSAPAPAIVAARPEPPAELPTVRPAPPARPRGRAHRASSADLAAAPRSVAPRRSRQPRPIAVAAVARREVQSRNRLRTGAAFTAADRLGASKPLAISRTIEPDPADAERSVEIPEPGVLNAIDAPRVELEFTATTAD